jgi:CHAT domain-containing protein
MDLRRLVIGFLILASCGISPDAHYKSGRLLLKKGKYNEAMREADAGFDTEHSWRFRILKADIVMRARSDIKTAKELLSFTPPPSPSDAESQARLLTDEAYLESLASHNAKALIMLQQALEIAKPLGMPALEAVIENRTGLVAVQQARMDVAETAFRRVIELAAAQHEGDIEAGAMGNLGLMFQNSYDFEEAIYWFDKAGARFQQLGLADAYYQTLGNLGSCYLRLGDTDKGLADLEQAENYARKTGNRYLEQLWIGNTGSGLYDRGEIQKAAAKFKQALEMAQSRDKDEKDMTGWWYYSLATTAIDLGDFDAADAYNKQAIDRRQALANRSDFYPRVNEAHIAAGRKDPGAEALYRGLIAEYHAGMNPVPMLEARAGLAGLLAQKGEFDQADAQFRSALAELESERSALASDENRMTYLAKLIRFYDHYLNFLVDRGQTEKALEVAESSRARVLDEELHAKFVHAPVSAARMRELAKSSGTVFLCYWLGKERSFLWAVTPAGITLHQLPAESQITPLVAGYRSFIENLRDPLQSEFPAGLKLVEILLAPAREALGSGARIVVVPDRALYSVNFETLPDPEDHSKYLIERVKLEVAPSLDVLAGPRPAPNKGPGSLLLIGNPEQAVEEYPRLPYAANEIAAISKEFPQDRQMVLEGAQAYPAAYREAKPDRFSWIHFAAHASANRTSPLDSTLILSRNDGGYQLSAREAMNVPLNARLVTLSACRSAGAKTFSGEGQVGLSWAFLRAGAAGVVAGLWDVTDRSTAQLMADFYEQLAQGSAPVDALRHAKLTLLHGGKAYQKPFYWGPFQLYAGTI